MGRCDRYRRRHGVYICRSRCVKRQNFLHNANFNVRSGYFSVAQSRLSTAAFDRGILLQAYSLGPFPLWESGSYYCVGVIPWENFADAGLTKSQWTQCLGLSVADLRTFLNSRVQFTEEQTLKALKSNKIATGTFGRLTGDSMLRFTGHTKMPRSGEEADILEWNRENFGYHIVIPARPLWFFGRPLKGGAKKVAEVIRSGPGSLNSFPRFISGFRVG
jgi:hypothetical protein